jgi:hypothetical protein
MTGGPKPIPGMSHSRLVEGGTQRDTPKNFCRTLVPRSLLGESTPLGFSPGQDTRVAAVAVGRA